MNFDSGLKFLTNEQSSDGNFLSYSSPNPKDFTGAKVYRTTFLTALILDCLNKLPDSHYRNKIQEKAARFLISQKSGDFTFNYWDRRSGEFKTMPYPDDLDDTFCALAALHNFNNKIINGLALAKIVKILTATEKEPGGPYQTWLVSKNAKLIWHDVDLAVNNNVAYFLSLFKINIPSLFELTEAAILKQSFTSRYYPDFYPTIYFIAQWYRGALSKSLIKFLLKRKNKDDNWGDPLSTALAVSALLHLGLSPLRVKPSINYLKKTQLKDGSWPAYGFCFDPAMAGRPFYAGSPALTTAFCLGAIAKFYRSSFDYHDNRIDDSDRREAISIVTQRFSQLPEPVKTLASNMATNLLKIDAVQPIAGLPSLFTKCLKPRYRNQVSKKTLARLGAANFFGWIAYTIYDDFIDEEGDPVLVGVANICLREVVKIFGDIDFGKNKKSFEVIFQEIMDRLDNANSWEAKSRALRKIPQFGDLSVLADRSLGHALGPLATLHMFSRIDEPTIQAIKKFFKHYLIARQLSDDMHDWQEDLAKGHISAVGAIILQTINKKKAGIDDFRIWFWRQTVKDVCKRISIELSQARQAIGQSKVIHKPDELINIMLFPIEKTVQKTLNEQAMMIEFLAEY